MSVSYCIINRVLYRTENVNKKFFQSINIFCPICTSMYICPNRIRFAWFNFVIAKFVQRLDEYYTSVQQLCKTTKNTKNV